MVSKQQPRMREFFDRVQELEAADKPWPYVATMSSKTSLELRAEVDADIARFTGDDQKERSRVLLGTKVKGRLPRAQTPKGYAWSLIEVPIRVESSAADAIVVLSLGK